MFFGCFFEVSHPFLMPVLQDGWSMTFSRPAVAAQTRSKSTFSRAAGVHDVRTLP